MSLRSRPLWFEGQLVRPQHLQQLVRWTETEAAMLQRAVLSDGWGVHTLEPDATALPLGRVGIARALLMLPDGTSIEIPGRDEPPPPLLIATEHVGRIVALALPMRSGDSSEIAVGGRYRRENQSVRDSTGDGSAADVPVGRANLRLVLDGEVPDASVAVRLFRVAAADSSGALTLDAAFLPPCLRIGAHPALAGIAREVAAMLGNAAIALARRVDPARGGGDLAGMLDFTLLSTVNGARGVFMSLAEDPGAPLRSLHAEMTRLAGTLATYGQSVRESGELPGWRHADPGESLMPLLVAIRERLGDASRGAAVPLPLTTRGQGIFVSPVIDRGLFDDARFVLTVTSAVDPERVRTTFPREAKMGPAEAIQDLVNLQLPGIALRPMPVAPRELPYRTGTVFFELDRNGALWRQMATSPAFVLHVGAPIAELRMEFWALRGV